MMFVVVVLLISKIRSLSVCGGSRGVLINGRGSSKGGELIGIDGIVVVGVKRDVVNVVGVIVEIVDGGVDGLIMSPFNNEAGGLDEGLALFFGKGLNPGDGSVSHRDLGPVMTGNFVACGQRQEEVIALCVAGGREGNGAEGAGA